MIRMKLDGAKELKAKFEAIKKDMFEALAAGLVAGGFPILNATKDGAPYLSGNLARSYHMGTESQEVTPPQVTDTSPQPVNRSAVAAMAADLRKTGKTKLLIGTDVEYAPPQEFIYTPHLRPALDGHRKDVPIEASRAIKQVIQKAETT